MMASLDGGQFPETQEPRAAWTAPRASIRRRSEPPAPPCAQTAPPERTLKQQEPPLAQAATARLARRKTGCAEATHLESASRVDPVPPAKTASGASQAPLEVVRRVAPAHTRQRRGRPRATHARLLQRVRPGPTVSTAMGALKGPARLAEGVQPVNIASSVSLSRRDNAPPAGQARTRRARDPSPA